MAFVLSWLRYKLIQWDKAVKATTFISQIYKPGLEESTKIAELKIAAFIAENCSLLTVDIYKYTTVARPFIGCVEKP